MEYPAAARVLLLTPWRPVKDGAPVWLGLVVMNDCSTVPDHGASSLSSSAHSSCSLSLSDLGRPLLLSLSTAAFVFASLACASLRFLVSARMAVMESVGREMVLIVEVWWVWARDFRRVYSAWWRCCVKVCAAERNSSSTMI